MSNVVETIQKIAKTALLEEKVGKALSLAQVANQNNKSAITGEAATVAANAAVASATTIAGPVSQSVTTADTTAQVLAQQSNPAGDMSASSQIQTSGNSLYINQANANTTVTDGYLSSIGSVAAGAIAAGGVNSNVANGGNIAGIVATSSGKSSQGGNSASGSGGGGGGSGGANSTSPSGATNKSIGDLSSAANVQDGNVGGYDVLMMSTQAGSDPALQSQIAYMQSIGTPQVVIQKYIDGYVSSTYNSGESSTSGNGVGAGQPGVYSAIQYANNDPYLPKVGSGEVLNAIAGFVTDSAGNLVTSSVTSKPLAVKLQLTNNNPPTPTPVDTYAGGQLALWANGYTAPQYRGFQAGFMWACSNPTYYVADTPEQAASGSVAAYIASNPSPYPIGNGSTYIDQGSFTQSSSSSWIFTWYDHHGGSPNNVTVNALSCVVGGNVTCPSTAPTYKSWPKTGAIILSLFGGKINYSPFDSEVPLFNTLGQSYIKMAVGNGTDVIDNRSLSVQPAVGGGFLVSVLDNVGAFTTATYYNAFGSPLITNLTAAEAAALAPR